MRYELHEIDVFRERMGQISLVYVDNDGDLDHNGDVDRDDDIDICTKPWNGGLHIYLENKLID